MATANSLKATAQSSVSHQKNIQGQANHLQMRWQGIRLQEIRRQLSIMSDQSFFITTGTQIQCSKIIYIPEEALVLPIEVLAAIAAWSWAQKMQANHPACDKQIDVSIDFVGQFLARFHYPIEKVIQFCLNPTHPELIKTFELLSKHLLSLVLIYQRCYQKNAQIQRRSKIKNKPFSHKDCGIDISDM